MMLVCEHIPYFYKSSLYWFLDFFSLYNLKILLISLVFLFKKKKKDIPTVFKETFSFNFFFKKHSLKIKTILAIKKG